MMSNSSVVSLAAEQCVLGAILIDGKALACVQNILAPVDFHDDGHRRIYSAMTRLAADGIDIDLITVDDALTASNQSPLTGGFGYLGQIANATPSAANIVSYANIVKGRSQARQYTEHAIAVAQAAKTPTGDVAEALARLNGFQEAVSASSGLFFPSAPSLTNIHRDPKPEFDFVLPSLPTGMVGALAGHGSAGKGYVSLAIGMDVAAGKGRLTGFELTMPGRVAFVSIEDDLIALQGRQKVIIESLDVGYRDEFVTEVAQNFSAISVYGRPQFRLLERRDGRLCRNEAAIAAFKRTFSGYRLIIADTLRKFFGIDENKSDEAAEAMAVLEDIARETGAAVIYIHHLSKPANNQAESVPTIFDIRGSGALVADARWAAIYAKPTASFVQKENVSIFENEMDDWRVLDIAKHNHGAGGKHWFHRVNGGVFFGADPNAKRASAGGSLTKDQRMAAAMKRPVAVTVVARDRSDSIADAVFGRISHE